MDLKSYSLNIELRQFPIAWQGHWLGGQWHSQPPSKQAKPSLNPNSGKPLVETVADKNVIPKAVDSAESAREALAKMTIAERMTMVSSMRRLLGDYSRTVVDILRIESGKPLWEAEADVETALKHLSHVSENGEKLYDEALRFFAGGRAEKHAATLLPVGTVLAYLPFSTPMTSFALYYSAALLAGCPLILMPSSHAVLSGILLGLLHEAMDSLPGAFNVLFGNFHVFRQALLDRRIEAVIFTGSREHCDTIRQESRHFLGRQLILQSGGKNAVVVHSSADIPKAVQCTLYGALRSAGQLCTSTSRVFIYRSKQDEFQQCLLEELQKIKIGPADVQGTTQGPHMGPLYALKGVEKFLRFQTMAHRDAKETLVWGKALETGTQGFFVSPGVHILESVDLNSAYQANVMFAPDLALYIYDRLDDALKQANMTDAPFVLAFMGDPEALLVRRNIALAPNLVMNASTAEIDASMPLAGRLQSGHHRVNGASLFWLLTYPQMAQTYPPERPALDGWPTQ